MDSVCGATINGNLQWQNNRAPVTIGGPGCQGNQVGGNLQVQNNTMPSGYSGPAATIEGNTVRGNLQSQNNTPPAVVSGNTVKGNTQTSQHLRLVARGGAAAPPPRGASAGRRDQRHSRSATKGPGHPSNPALSSLRSEQHSGRPRGCRNGPIAAVKDRVATLPLPGATSPPYPRQSRSSAPSRRTTEAAAAAL